MRKWLPTILLLCLPLHSAYAGLKDHRYPYEQKLTEQAKVNLHIGFSAGFGMAAAAGFDLVAPNASASSKWIGATGLAMIPGVGKEVYDKWIRGFEIGWDDLAYDLAGCVLGQVTYFGMKESAKMAIRVFPSKLVVVKNF